MRRLWIWQVAMLLAIFALWQVATDPELIPPFVWADNASRAAPSLTDIIAMTAATPRTTPSTLSEVRSL